MEVKELPLDQLIPYVNNPRNNDDAVDDVAASIHEYGWQQPIVVDRDNVIIIGHTRYKAAKKLGLTTAPCVYADKLTPAQVKALRIADNKVGEKAGWNRELLKIELEEIKETDLDLSLTGFTTLELEAIMGEDVDIDQFFEDNEGAGAAEKEPKWYRCPCCGEVFSEADMKEANK